jgi:hypothetical protein
MKFLSTILPLAAVLALSPVCAGAYTIVDTFTGGTATGGNVSQNTYWGNQDVIGDMKIFDTWKMEVNVSGNIMTVDIYSAFFNDPSNPNRQYYNTQMGDLFISTGGDKNWDYAVVLDQHNQRVSSGGTVYLYETKDGTILKSYMPSGYIYRKDEMYRFTPNTSANALDTRSWRIDNINEIVNSITYDKLTLTFDISDLQEDRTSPNWAFHWAMSCGNDVIEGEAPIPNPEPSTFLLTGLGILGAACLGRRRKQ